MNREWYWIGCIVVARQKSIHSSGTPTPRKKWYALPSCGSLLRICHRCASLYSVPDCYYSTEKTRREQEFRRGAGSPRVADADGGDSGSGVLSCQATECRPKTHLLAAHSEVQEEDAKD